MPTKRKSDNTSNTCLRDPGIEPGSVPWQGTILPLNQPCVLPQNARNTRALRAFCGNNTQLSVPSEKAYDAQASENGRRRAGAAAGSSCARPPWQATKVPPSAGYSSTCTLGYTLAVYMKPKVNIERQCNACLTDDSKTSQVCIGRNWLCVQAYSVRAFCMNMPGKSSSGSQAVQSDACLLDCLA